MHEHTRTPNDESDPPTVEETIRLLALVRSGDEQALNSLLARLLPRLRRWAHGRLPRSSRGMLETGDIVAMVVEKAVRQFAVLRIERSIGLTCYLKSAISNELASQWRRVDRTPINTTLGDSLPADDESPLDRLIGLERRERYERALARLDDDEQEAIVGRFEMAYDYEDLADLLGVPSAGAARTAVCRALKRLTEEARHV